MTKLQPIGLLEVELSGVSSHCSPTGSLLLMQTISSETTVVVHASDSSTRKAEVGEL
jgi:hypothetical protein